MTRPSFSVFKRQLFQRSPAASNSMRSFRPQLEYLEDRITPTGPGITPTGPEITLATAAFSPNYVNLANVSVGASEVFTVTLAAQGGNFGLDSVELFSQESSDFEVLEMDLVSNDGSPTSSVDGSTLPQQDVIDLGPNINLIAPGWLITDNQSVVFTIQFTRSVQGYEQGDLIVGGTSFLPITSSGRISLIGLQMDTNVPPVVSATADAIPGQPGSYALAAVPPTDDGGGTYTWSTSASESPLSPDPFSYPSDPSVDPATVATPTYTADQNGITTLTVQYTDPQGNYGEASVVIIPGLAVVTLAPADATVNEGGTETYSASGWTGDPSNLTNFLGDITAYTTFSISGTNPAKSAGSFSGNELTAGVAGDYTVTGTVNTEHVDGTTGLTVLDTPPAGADHAVTTLEDTRYAFNAADFGFSDSYDNFYAVEITTLPGAGTLTDQGNVVSAGQFVPVADINGGVLVYTPAANASGAPYTSFTFQVQDDGGTAQGGADLDPVPKTMTIDVTPLDPDHLAFTVQPSTAVRGVAITPAVAVEVLDKSGNLVVSDNADSITVAIGNNPSNGTLSGTQTAIVHKGVATFDSLSIDKTGVGYTLAASAGSLGSAVSTPFNIVKPGPIPFVFDDSADSANVIYTITSSTIQINNATPISFAGRGSVTVRGGSGNDIFVFAADVTIPFGIVGGSGNNTVVGPNRSNSWVITGKNAGTLNHSVAFANVGNLTGGSTTDGFLFWPMALLTGSIDGGPGPNTLDYSAYPGNILVDLPLGVASLVGGNVRNIQKVIGGAGNSILVGAGGATLFGGTGRNLLIAGSQAATLVGGSDQDILVGGSTDYDTNPTALNALMAEWARTDEAYGVRVDHLLHGGGLNGATLLNASTFHANGGGNTLNGKSGLDLFFGSLALDLYDWNGVLGEQFI